MDPDEREAIRRDPVRLRLKDLLRRNDLTLTAASLALDRNQTYLQQYVDRGVPAVLGYRDGEVLAEMLGCDPAELRHENPPKRKPMKRRRLRPRLPGAPVAAVPELEVEAAAGAATLAGESVFEIERWGWPENMIRYEAGADPDNLRVIRVRGNSMEPEMSEGDRIALDFSRRLPATGETFIIWDGNGLVVKQVETVHDDAEGDPPRLRLISANPGYATYTRPVKDVKIIGKVMWVVKRV